MKLGRFIFELIRYSQLQNWAGLDMLEVLNGWKLYETETAEKCTIIICYI